MPYNVSMLKLYGSNPMTPSITSEIEMPWGMVPIYEVTNFDDVIRALRQDPEIIFCEAFYDLVEKLIIGNKGIGTFLRLREKHEDNLAKADPDQGEAIVDQHWSDIFDFYMGERGENTPENRAMLFCLLKFYINGIPDQLDFLFSKIFDA
jgi:hypothetical protein